MLRRFFKINYLCAVNPTVNYFFIKPNMNPKRKIQIGKFISLILRHNPGAANVTLDENGWADVQQLLKGLNENDMPVTFEMLEEMVYDTSDKARYIFNDDKTRIRAVHGHSVKVDLGYQPETPPEFLFHGTATANLKSIRSKGIEKRSRQQVHLSMDVATAKLTGMRHGFPAVLRIRAGEMHAAGMQFFHSSSNVWLTDAIPASYIDFPEEY